MARITAETAAEFGRKGAEGLARRRAIENAASSPIPPDIRAVRGRMEKLMTLMRGQPASKVWDELTRSYERLFKVWVHLAGVPGPGQRRPGPEKTKRKAPVVPEPENPPQVIESEDIV